MIEKLNLEKRENEIKIALAGNPNSGKTTIFNEMTGAKQHVGNWAGVTVEKKVGKSFYDNYEFEVVDLPGTYSLGAYSEDEVVARDFLIDGNYNLILDIINSVNLERNLYFTVQLLEMGVDLIAVLNMADEAKKKKIEINKNKLSERLGVEVVETVAKRGKGIDDLFSKIIKNRNSNKEGLKINYGEDIEKLILKIKNEFKNLKFSGIVNQRWIALKLIERDPEIEKLLKRKAGDSILRKIK
ncbi:MAG: FeoB small GTPase domain-containing protein, partial [Bacillota bacterium]